MNTVVTPCSSCPSVEQLRFFAAGDVEESLAESLAMHLDDCESCLMTVRRLEMSDLQNPFFASLRYVVAEMSEQDEAQFRRLDGESHGSASQHATPRMASTVESSSAGLNPAHEKPIDPVTTRKLRDRLLKLNDSYRAGTSQERPPGDASGKAWLDPELLMLLEPAREEGELGWLKDFRIERLLGRSESGWVVLANDTRFRRRVALKLKRFPSSVQPQQIGRFLRELQRLVAVRSAYVVRIHEVGEVETRLGPLPYVTMEYLHGESLAERLRRGPLPSDEIIRLGRQLIQGLVTIHAAGLQHREVKVNQIWLEWTTEADQVARACLLDFGIGPFCSEQTGEVSGNWSATRSWMSPEQSVGKVTDPRSDLFSLGTVLYAMATGRNPFQHESLSAVRVALNGESPVPPDRVNGDIPEFLSRLILRLLEKKPRKRFRHAQALLEAWDSRTADARPKRLAIPRSARFGALGMDALVPRQNPRRRGLAVLIGLLITGVFVGWGSWWIWIKTANGTTLLETPMEGVSIRILKGGKTIIEQTTDRKIKLLEGDYEFELVNPAKDWNLAPHSLKVRRGEETVVRIWREPNVASQADRPSRPAQDTMEPPIRSERQEPSRGAVEGANESGKGSRMVASEPTRMGKIWGEGSVDMEGDELVLKTESGLFQLQFGDPSWSEYDFQVDCRQDEGQGNVFVCYRCVDGQNRRQVSLGSFENRYLGADLWVDGTWSGLRGESWSLEPGRWHQVRVEVRETHTDVYLDGVRRLSETSPMHPRGMVGLAIQRGRSRFRAIRVSSPQGTPLWEGSPAIKSDSKSNEGQD